MEFVLGVIVGVFACYVILREKINVGRLLWIVAIVLFALIFVGGLLLFPVTEELTLGEVRETRRENLLPE
jgi:membrane associated rhomboid family serine protease